MKKTNKWIWIAGVGFLLLLSVGVWVATSESEEDRLEAWLQQTLERLPALEAEGYLELVNLEQYGFRLSVPRDKAAFGAKDRDKLLERVRRYRVGVAGCKLDLRSFKPEITGKVAKIEATVLWERAQAKGPAPSALIQVNAQVVRQGDSWRFSRLDLTPSRNPLQRIF